MLTTVDFSYVRTLMIAFVIPLINRGTYSDSDILNRICLFVFVGEIQLLAPQILMFLLPRYMMHIDFTLQ